MKVSLAMNVISFVGAIVAACMFSIDGKKSPDVECSYIYYKMDGAILYCPFFWVCISVIPMMCFTVLFKLIFHLLCSTFKYTEVKHSQLPSHKLQFGVKLQGGA